MGGRGRVPYNKYRGDAGYDLFISRPALIAPRSFADVHTDVAIEMPRGLWGRITGRSSTLRKRGLLVNEGVIDGEYRGELFIGVFNLQDDAVQVEEGDRIGQIIFQSQEIVTWEERKTLTISDRGTEGFGSTGK
jgi:dUTP pyrophosphatase